MPRLLGSSALAAAALMLAAYPALAGGWAVTTLDTLPADGLHARQSFVVGFTIRQHGVTPFNQATPRIRASLGDTNLSFAATRDGTGHYVARVELPRAGTWTWAVDQTPFATQELGTLTVHPPVAEAPAVAPAAVATTSLQQALLGYAFAGLLALVVLLWRRPLFARGLK
jgi:hypothetical protein